MSRMSTLPSRWKSMVRKPVSAWRTSVRYAFYGVCWCLIAHNWFTFDQWQWWLLVVGLAVLHALVCRYTGGLYVLSKEIRKVRDDVDKFKKTKASS